MNVGRGFCFLWLWYFINENQKRWWSQTFKLVWVTLIYFMRIWGILGFHILFKAREDDKKFYWGQIKIKFKLRNDIMKNLKT